MSTSEQQVEQVDGRVGSTVGKYTLLKLLGMGGMASVYEGVHRNGNRVAVKLLHRDLCAYPEIRGRFLREGYVANKVGHRGAVKVLDDDVAADGSAFLVMELLHGENAEEYAVRSGGILTPPEVTRIARQLLEVLGAAHANGIVHRDIKPENLFLDEDSGLLKVLDFGIARLVESGAQKTRTGNLMGTPSYMAPEQARGMTREIDAQTDLWAVGATMFRLLTGRLVFEAETPELVMVAVATQSAPRIHSINPLVPRWMAHVIDRALVERQARWPNANAMLQAVLEMREPPVVSSGGGGGGSHAGALDVTAPPSTEPITPGRLPTESGLALDRTQNAADAFSKLQSAPAVLAKLSPEVQRTLPMSNAPGSGNRSSEPQSSTAPIRAPQQQVASPPRIDRPTPSPSPVRVSSVDETPVVLPTSSSAKLIGALAFVVLLMIGGLVAVVALLREPERKTTNETPSRASAGEVAPSSTTSASLSAQSPAPVVHDTASAPSSSASAVAASSSTEPRAIGGASNKPASTTTTTPTTKGSAIPIE